MHVRVCLCFVMLLLGQITKQERPCNTDIEAAMALRGTETLAGHNAYVSQADTLACHGPGPAPWWGVFPLPPMLLMPFRTEELPQREVTVTPGSHAV